MIRFLQQNNNIHYTRNLPFFTSSKPVHGKTRWRRSADQILVVKVKATLELPNLTMRRRGDCGVGHPGEGHARLVPEEAQGQDPHEGSQL
jgi:hypothetical protein